MELKNTSQGFGVITKFFHWLIAIAFLLQFFWVYWKRYMLPEGSKLGGVFIGQLHKPIGALILIVGLMALIWRHRNIRPEYPPLMPAWEKTAAKITHIALYFLILLFPISGILMSTYAGYPIKFWGFYQLPLFLEKNKEMGTFFYNIHEILGYITMGVIGVHIGAALKHHFISKDNILTRMLPWGK